MAIDSAEKRNRALHFWQPWFARVTPDTEITALDRAGLFGSYYSGRTTGGGGANIAGAARVSHVGYITEAYIPAQCAGSWVQFEITKSGRDFDFELEGYQFTYNIFEAKI